MTSYLKYKLKELLTNAELLGWSIGFIEFWVFMWIFVFTPVSMVDEWTKIFLQVNTGLAYSFLGVLSMAAAGAGLTGGIYRSSIPTRYITKFSRLGPALYLLEDFLASLAAILVYVLVIFVSVIGLSYARWGVIALPYSPVGIFAGLLMAAVTFYWLSYAFALAIVVTRRTRALTIASYTPLILGFTAYSQLWIDFGSAVYFTPVVPLIGLLAYHGTGMYPPTGAYLGWLYSDKLYPALNLRLAAASSITWIAILIVISMILLRESRGVSIEEIKL
ncbi:MAG: hypothetical protein QW819_04360 [Candidatus Korarchaeota archaeon]|nr:hypothetical protein [Thermoproteota archaeon]